MTFGFVDRRSIQLSYGRGARRASRRSILRGADSHADQARAEMGQRSERLSSSDGGVFFGLAGDRDLFANVDQVAGDLEAAVAEQVEAAP